ncbi:MAG: hypothetical protein O2887_08075 [Bacteroidetes bacterium]|nr:hypothetical protein [Bacteroidota bacterium]MDA1120436.1 hypothetical protein [Bacteroidota bacterium]
MTLNKNAVKAFSASITLGRNVGYSDTLIDKAAVIAFIQGYQNELIMNKNIHLSVSLSECEIILSGQREPHLKLNFINYPKFPLSEKQLKEEIEKMAKSLIEKFEQNRVVIEYPDETIMLENSGEIDPDIIMREY